MKKKLFAALIIVCLCTGLAACGSKNIESSDNAGSGSMFEPIASDDKPAVQKEDSSALPEGIEFNSADGFYSGYLKSSDKDKIGAVNENGVMYSIISNAEIIGDNLIIYGNFGYRNSQDQDIISVSDEGIYAFTIDESTAFQYLGGEDGAEALSKEDFMKELSSLLDSGLLFEVEISDSVAKTVSFAS